jgi:hypothetical protein
LGSGELIVDTFENGGQVYGSAWLSIWELSE